MTYRIVADAANRNNRRITSDHDRHVAKVYGYNQEEVELKAEGIVNALNMQVVKPMSDAPRDRPFLTQFKGELGGGTTFCRFRPENYIMPSVDLDSPAWLQWDVGSAAFFADIHFVGWTELPTAFSAPVFQD